MQRSVTPTFKSEPRLFENSRSKPYFLQSFLWTALDIPREQLVRASQATGVSFLALGGQPEAVDGTHPDHQDRKGNDTPTLQLSTPDSHPAKVHRVLSRLPDEGEL